MPGTASTTAVPCTFAERGTLEVWIMLRPVAAGIDGSPESLAAAHWAAREALRRGTALRLVHAWQWREGPAPSRPAAVPRRDGAEDLLTGVADGLRAAHPGLLVHGRPAEEAPVTALLAAADEADLLVLGSRGLSGATGYLLGSISQRIVSGAPVPVVLVRAGGPNRGGHVAAPGGYPVDPAPGGLPADAAPAGFRPDPVPGGDSREVVLGLGTGRAHDETVAFAFEAARLRGAVLHAVHVYRAPDPVTAARLAEVDGPRLLAEHERAVVSALGPWCGKFPEVPVAETVSQGRPAAELVRAAAGAALVVVGRGERETRFGTCLGPVAHAVLHHADCPVAVVPYT
ncbi:universal stress protein [Streptomyces sp. NPDC051997]|uniref:universal stress protein n=1 Tax=Streptomyces sp. NPDC051997 TaxID=3155611 RepID=UPI00343C3DA9